MANSVLLYEFLSKEKLDRALAEIRSISFGKVVIPVVIASDGGNAVSAVHFVEAVKNLPIQCEVKIYKASSTAAYIALAIARTSQWVEMSKESTLNLHRGEITLSPSQIGPDGKVDEGLVDSFKKYDADLVDTLKKFKLNRDNEFMTEFYATDWLRIPAEECLRRGIVKSLF